MTAPDVRTPGSNPANAENQTTNKPADSGAFRPVAQKMSDYARKRHARLQAEAALRGVALHRLADGRWLASRWNLTRELADTEVEGWLARIGGAP